MEQVTASDNKLFMTQFLVVSVLSHNVSLDLDEICGVLNKTLSIPRTRVRIEAALDNLRSRGIVKVTEFGNFCLSSEHKTILRI